MGIFTLEDNMRDFAGEGWEGPRDPPPPEKPRHPLWPFRYVLAVVATAAGIAIYLAFH